MARQDPKGIATQGQRTQGGLAIGVDFASRRPCEAIPLGSWRCHAARAVIRDVRKGNLPGCRMVMGWYCEVLGGICEDARPARARGEGRAHYPGGQLNSEARARERTGPVPAAGTGSPATLRHGKEGTRSRASNPKSRTASSTGAEEHKTP